MCTALYFTPCPVPSCPTYEPNSNDCEYSHPFRHIQYNRIASLRPIATLAMRRDKSIAKVAMIQGASWNRFNFCSATYLCKRRKNTWDVSSDSDTP